MAWPVPSNSTVPNRLPAAFIRLPVDLTLRAFGTSVAGVVEMGAFADGSGEGADGSDDVEPSATRVARYGVVRRGSGIAGQRHGAGDGENLCAAHHQNVTTMGQLTTKPPARRLRRSGLVGPSAPLTI